jgi:hypothetical protein
LTFCKEIKKLTTENFDTASRAIRLRRILAEAFAGTFMTFCALVFVGTFLPFLHPNEHTRYEYSENPSALRTVIGSVISLGLFFVAMWGNRLAGRLRIKENTRKSNAEQE